MTKQEKIQSLENSAYNLRAIFVCLALNGDEGNPKREIALETAKMNYDKVLAELESLKEE